MKLSSLIAVILFAFSLSACSGNNAVATTLFGRKAPPDEFSVVTRAPLSLPPEYKLRPPREGGLQRESKVRDQARANMLGNPVDRTVTNRSLGETSLLEKAGAHNVSPHIREIINREAAQLASTEQSFTEKLLFWQEPQEKDLINPIEENERLQKDGKVEKKAPMPTIKRD